MLQESGSEALLSITQWVPVWFCYCLRSERNHHLKLRTQAVCGQWAREGLCFVESPTVLTVYEALDSGSAQLPWYPFGLSALPSSLSSSFSWLPQPATSCKAHQGFFMKSLGGVILPSASRCQHISGSKIPCTWLDTCSFVN